MRQSYPLGVKEKIVKYTDKQLCMECQRRLLGTWSGIVKSKRKIGSSRQAFYLGLETELTARVKLRRDYARPISTAGMGKARELVDVI